MALKPFNIDTAEQIVPVSLDPKLFKHLGSKHKKTILSGQVRSLLQMGEKTNSGFVLKEPNVQVFEKKLKEPKEATATVASVVR